MRLFLFLFLSFFITSMHAQWNVSITGKANTYEGKAIKAFMYDDLVTYTERLLATDTISDSSSFTLNLHVPSTQYVLIKIEKQKGSLYVEPNGSYKINFPPKDTSRYFNPYAEQKIDLGIIIKDTNELNALVIDFNDQFDVFWRNNYQYFLKHAAQSKIDSFKVAMQKRYVGVKNSYFHTYLTYTIASWEESTFQSKRKLAFSYLLHKPIHYDNYEYMNFFNTFFKQYVQTFAHSKNGGDVFTQVNEKASHNGLMNVLKIDKYLENDTLRELVMLKGLYEMCHVSDFNRQQVIRIIEAVAQKGLVDTHKKIAQNMLFSFSRLQPGTPAPDFKLSDKNGKTVGLQDLQGQYVYMGFWSASCMACIQEMKVMAELKKKYGDKVIFLSISLDEEFQTMRTFLLKNQKYDWLFLHFSAYPKIKEDYEVVALPSYFLLDQKGHFIESPAQRPTGGIEARLHALTKVKEKKYRVGQK